jgi:hypothetical protein
MIRRNFLRSLGIIGIAAMGIFYFIDNSLTRRIFYKIEGLFRSPAKLPPDNERTEVELPDEGYNISVEMALNSRCTSDYDGNPKRFHWGMFDRTKKLSEAQVKEIVSLARIPRFTDRGVEIQHESNTLTFIIDNKASGPLRDFLMVESGMQQQAIGLICAALGVGMVFSNMGKDGTSISEKDYGTIKIKLGAMKPSYSGSFWSNASPSGRKFWRKGNLPEPVRKGDKPLLSVLDRLKTENRGGKVSSDAPLSQLLWAARGRTAHWYKSRPWGMTIPTWGGDQNISSIYLISNYQLARYVNWQKNKPAHSTDVLNEIDTETYDELTNLFPDYNCFIVIGKNENFGRALWEVGYQLLNLILQAQTLNLDYKAILLDKDQKLPFKNIGIKDPISLILLKKGNKK